MPVGSRMGTWDFGQIKRIRAMIQQIYGPGWATRVAERFFVAEHLVYSWAGGKLTKPPSIRGLKKILSVQVPDLHQEREKVIEKIRKTYDLRIQLQKQALTELTRLVEGKEQAWLAHRAQSKQLRRLTPGLDRTRGARSLHKPLPPSHRPKVRITSLDDLEIKGLE